MKDRERDTLKNRRKKRRIDYTWRSRFGPGFSLVMRRTLHDAPGWDRCLQHKEDNHVNPKWESKDAKKKRTSVELATEVAFQCRRRTHIRNSVVDYSKWTDARSLAYTLWKSNNNGTGWILNNILYSCVVVNGYIFLSAKVQEEKLMYLVQHQ